MTDADVLIVGGGIAGWSAAYFASRAGRAVTVIDDGRHRASDLPMALINPLRGHAGRLVAGGIEGMRTTFALIDALRIDGHAITAGRGLYRPLIDLDGAAATESHWRQHGDAGLAFDWHPHAPSSLGLVDDVPALCLHEPGWVVAPSLLQALRAASGASLLVDRVVALALLGASGSGATATLGDGRRLRARSVLWCGGAWGAAGLDDAVSGAEGATRDALYKPGSLFSSDVALTSEPMSFGLYALPIAHPPGRATLIGPSREGTQSSFPDSVLPPAAITHLQDRVARHFGSTMPLRPVWRGVRLARLSTAARIALLGIPTLTELGSRGFLIAPLRAARWAQSL